MTKLPYPVVRVKWLDSTGERGWQYIEQVGVGPLDVVSVGFLVKESKESITISSSFHAGCDQVDAPLTIPRQAILDMKNVRVPK